jgi:hypothetical protein
MVSCFLFVSSACAETVYVCVSEDSYLNGRARPSTKAEITMRLYNGDELEAVSFSNDWVEVIGGESGTSWCKAIYLSEIKEPLWFVNTSGGRVRARKTPVDGKGTGWVSSRDTIKVTKIVMGWGYTSIGWVDLSYFTQK